jgi:hypothetical protein
MYTNAIRASQDTCFVSATLVNRLMLFRKTIAVCCKNYTQHTNTLCGHNAEFWSVTADGTYSKVLSVLEPGYVIPCVGNLADEKFYVVNEVPRMTLLGTIVHRLAESMPTVTKSFT